MISRKRFRFFKFPKFSFPLSLPSFTFSGKKVFYFVLFLLISTSGYLFSGPAVPPETVIAVHQGQTLAEAAQTLKENNIIRNTKAFIVLSWLSRHQVVAGSYKFEGRTTLFTVSQRLTRGDFGLLAVRVLIPEGSTRAQIANILDKELSFFDKNSFLDITKNEEGFLFPDTYLFPSTITATEVADTMRKKFDEKVQDLLSEMRKKNISLKELVTMASIVEKEVNIAEDRKKVAGILWKRIKIDIPLQVDAPFVYTIGKGSYDLSKIDLATDSPYNTYTNKGLPPGPISNPGLDSLTASLYYEDSPYLFYLSDRKGNTHYAVTFEEHVENKKKYIY
jgi:UPF0755 protein